MFPGTQTSLIFWSLEGPGGPINHSKRGALRAPPLRVVSGAPGAVQTPKINDFWVPEKYIFMFILIRSWGYTRIIRPIYDSVTFERS